MEAIETEVAATYCPRCARATAYCWAMTIVLVAGGMLAFVHAMSHVGGKWQPALTWTQPSAVTRTVTSPHYPRAAQPTTAPAAPATRKPTPVKPAFEAKEAATDVKDPVRTAEPAAKVSLTVPTDAMPVYRADGTPAGWVKGNGAGLAPSQPLPEPRPRVGSPVSVKKVGASRSGGPRIYAPTQSSAPRAAARPTQPRSTTTTLADSRR